MGNSAAMPGKPVGEYYSKALSKKENDKTPTQEETAIFAGGCFWVC